MIKTKPKGIQSNEGIDDLNIIMTELSKNVPNQQKIKELTRKYGIEYNSKDPKILMNDLICFLNHQKFEKLTGSEL
jgi:hypothetical protein